MIAIQTTAGYKPYKTLVLDTLKLYTVAHGHKVCAIFFQRRDCIAGGAEKGKEESDSGIMTAAICGQKKGHTCCWCCYGLGSTRRVCEEKCWLTCRRRI